MDDLTLRLSNGTRLVVPASLGAITTYVGLEQETWFEKELPFLKSILAPGATAIDIGANLGVYSLAMSRLAGSSGRVFAYEPTSETRARLEKSRDLNAATNLTVVGAALSDSAREGRIVFGGSSELNHLGDDGDGEAVAITTLDAEWTRHGWDPPAFIKIDAEGEEEAIIRGARKLLTETSPLLMLEIKAEARVNTGLVDAVEALGYRAYRLLPAPHMLVPLDLDRLDGFELNMLALKADRAEEMEARGLLARERTPFTPTDDMVAEALGRLRAQPFAASFAPQFADGIEIHPAYLRALAAYDVFNQTDLAPSTRWGAIEYGVRTLKDLVNVDSRPARLSTLARMAVAAGNRILAPAALDMIVQSVKAGQLQLGEPFWPAHPRYDAIPTGNNPGQWFLAAVAEQLEISASFSLMFTPPTRTLGWLCGTPFATTPMLRRLWLSRVKGGQLDGLPELLGVEAPNNLNATLWKDGTVTRLPAVPAPGGELRA